MQSFRFRIRTRRDSDFSFAIGARKSRILGQFLTEAAVLTSLGGLIGVLVHCYGGQSRSRAVGAFAVEMLGGNSERYFETGSPNQYVYDVLETAWIRRQLGAF